MQTFKEKAMVAMERGIEDLGVYIIYIFLSTVSLLRKFLPMSMFESDLNIIFGDFDDGEYGDLGSDDLSQGDDHDTGSDDLSQGEDHDMGYLILRLIFTDIMLELMILRIIFAIYLIEDSAESYLDDELGNHGDEHDENCGSECIDLGPDKDHESGNISREWKEDETNESGTNNFAVEESSNGKGLSEYEEYDIEAFKRSAEEDSSNKYQDDESSDGNYLSKHVSNNDSNSDEEETRENGTEAIGGELNSKAFRSLEGHDDDSVRFVESEDNDAMEESMFTATNHEWLLVDMQNLDSKNETASSYRRGRLTEGWCYILGGLRSHRK